jgi:hypothetical protein
MQHDAPPHAQLPWTQNMHNIYEHTVAATGNTKPSQQQLQCSGSGDALMYDDQMARWTARPWAMDSSSMSILLTCPCHAMPCYSADHRQRVKQPAVLAGPVEHATESGCAVSMLLAAP